MMYSAYKLNKQGDNIQPWHTPFLIWNQSDVPCPVLIVASWPAYRFLKRQVRWSGTPISLRIFHSLLWSTQSKSLAKSIKQKNSIEVLKKSEIELSNSLAIPLLEKLNSKRYMHLYVHCSIIYNSQDLETTYMSINRWMNKEDVVCIHTYTETHRQWNIIQL